MTAATTIARLTIAVLTTAVETAAPFRQQRMGRPAAPPQGDAHASIDILQNSDGCCCTS
jgi:hypothetical protein